MRLLNVRTFRVKDFTDPDIPPYAILSHVWIQRRKTMKEPPEPTLQDMWTGKAKELVGFRKIYHAASQAIKENLGYIWVDTVCIDKTNSTELFEAINSMFRWYAEARTCYAYLADVHEIADLSRSAWFTRGWTLQEMLAPQNVAFYSAGWHFLGHRADLSLEKPILEATGILEEQKSVLQSFDLGSWSIAERMSWASRRRTTRKEDLAYCLLGIFGVNMPLLYGEGESAAFIRLQGEIMKVSDDHSLFAWTAPETCLASFAGLLATTPAYFGHLRSEIGKYDWRPSDVAYYEETPTPYHMTNQGIAIDLPLVPLNPILPSMYYALLGYGPKQKRPAIIVTRLYRNEFARIRADRFVTPELIRSDDENPYQEHMETLIDMSKVYGILVRQHWLKTRSTHRSARMFLECSQVRSAGVKLESVDTRCDWYERSMLLHGNKMLPDKMGSSSGIVAIYNFALKNDIKFSMSVDLDGLIKLESPNEVNPPWMLSDRILPGQTEDGEPTRLSTRTMSKIVLSKDGNDFFEHRVIVVTACSFIEKDISRKDFFHSVLLQAFYEKFHLSLPEQRFVQNTGSFLRDCAAATSAVIAMHRWWMPHFRKWPMVGSLLYFSLLPSLYVGYQNLEAWAVRYRDLKSSGQLKSDYAFQKDPDEDYDVASVMESLFGSVPSAPPEDATRTDSNLAYGTLPAESGQEADIALAYGAMVPILLLDPPDETDDDTDPILRGSVIPPLVHEQGIGPKEVVTSEHV